MSDSGHAKVELVSATRLTEDEFWAKSALGLSLLRLGPYDARLITHITYENQRGLPSLYNERIAAKNDHTHLVFIHDDVWIDDYFLVDRIVEGCAAFDVIGVAGNRRLADNQVAWCFLDASFEWDAAENLSGSIATGPNPFGGPERFGDAKLACELLDGVFLAAQKSTLVDKRVIFDPQFSFHFYDMDFCRTARENDLRLGTWPICLTHQSGGGFGSPSWSETLQRYRGKWQS